MKVISYIFMIALTAVLLTACGSKQNDGVTDIPDEVPVETGSNTITKVPTDAENDAITKAPADTESDIRKDATADASSIPKERQEAQKAESQKSDTIISEEEAKGIALKDAKLTDSEISKLRIKLERDDGIQVYEVDFYSNEREYDYEIDAKSGKILEIDEEPID